MADPIYRTVITVEVFSTEPYGPRGLADVAYTLDYGGEIGGIDWSESIPVPPHQVRDHLLRIGNDGTFFDDPWSEDGE